MRKLLLSILAVVGVIFAGLGQNKMIHGTVTDAAGNPVVGAAVVVTGTGTGVTTNPEGRFAVSAPANGSLDVSFLGYVTQRVAINNQTNVKITLQEDTHALDEVIVVAFGQTTKEAFTGSAAVVKSEDIEKVQTSNVATALTGKVAGVQMSSSTGDLGATPSIRVRGFGSINAGQAPLWVVDGMPYEGDLNNINTADIENVTVLKDAASNALYGARGANGVIMVTTKRAKSGDAKVSIDAKWGVNAKALESYETINDPAKYYETAYHSLYNYYRNASGYSATDAWRAAAAGIITNGEGGLGYNVYTLPAGELLIGQDGKLNPNAKLGRTFTYTDTEGNTQSYTLRPDNWLDEAYRTSFRQEYNVNVTGATDKSNFYLSLGYLDNKGIIRSSELQRYTARLKADYQAKKWLKVGGNVSYAHYNSSNGNSSDGSSSSTANIFAFASQIAPIYPLYIRDGEGNIMRDANGYKMYDYGNAQVGKGGIPNHTRPMLGDSNALQTSWLNKSKGDGNAFSGSGFAEFNIYDGLKLTVNGSTTLDETRWTDMSNPYYGQFAEAGGTLTKEHDRIFAYNLQQLLSYTKTFGEVHNLDLLAGHEMYRTRTYVLYGYKTKLFSYDTEELGGAVIDGQSSGSYVNDYNSEGYFGRAQYNYDERIFASLSYRRDASSRFHPDHRWGNFWSVGAAWILNRERWFNASWVDMLKIKASYGSQGNDNIGSYLYADLYSIENNDGEIATMFTQKGNPNITWETNANFNAGVEFGFWNGRLSGSVEYFNRKTTDMLFYFTVPSALGYDGYYSNIGDMSNQGIEIELNADLIRTKNVVWDFNVNATHLKNKIVKLADEYKTNNIGGHDGYINGNYFYAEGLPLYTYYIRESAGVNPATGEALWWQDVTDKEGNVIGRQATTDYSNATRYIQETTLPKLYGGFGTSISAYGFDASIQFTYQLGGKVYDSGYANFMTSPYSATTTGVNFHKDILNAWTPENRDSNIPRLQYGDQYTTGMSDRFLVTASYLNIQNINAGYTFPSKMTEKAGISKLRIYIACDNVFYWSARKGLDPRYSFSGTSNYANYSPIRTISGGVNIVF